MATGSSKSRCLVCQKDKATSKCMGCLEEFCFNHFVQHRQALGEQFDELENRRNIFRQTLTEQTTNLGQHPLMQQIDQWEKESIKKVQQTAEEARQTLSKYTDGQIKEIETKLEKLTEELKEIRDENDFNEIDLNQLKDKLNHLEEKFKTPSNISIKHDSSTVFINRISVIARPTNPHCNSLINARWIQDGITVAGGNDCGSALNQLNRPRGIYIDDDQTIYISDQSNHRIIKWKRNETIGQVVAGGNGEGNRNDQLKCPVKVVFSATNNSLIIADYENERVVRWPLQSGSIGETIVSNIKCGDLFMDSNGNLYVRDANRHEVRQYQMGDSTGTVVAGGNGSGSRLDQLKTPRCIFVDDDQSVYVSDTGNHRIMKWIKGAKEGVVIAGGQGAGNALNQLNNPHGLIVDQMGAVYVVDYGNDRVMCWLKDAKEGIIVIGIHGKCNHANLLNGPTDLSFDRENNLYIVDYGNHRVRKFLLDTSSNK